MYLLMWHCYYSCVSVCYICVLYRSMHAPAVESSCMLQGLKPLVLLTVTLALSFV